MSPNRFDALVARHFGDVLSGYGFSTDGSKYSTFWREFEGKIFHFILADPRRYAATYDVKVFFSSPHIDPQFHANFPDSLGIPTDNYCGLKPQVGVTYPGSQFPCKNEVAFVKGFELAVTPAHVEFAIPYLDQVTTVEHMLALARHPYFRRQTDG